MEYRFFDRGDDELIAASELPCERGIAVAVRTTGYEAGGAEVVELAICDLAGTPLFDQVVKPQNVEEWEACDASGGLGPADVAEAPELFQFEDEISELFEQADVVVAEHLAFAEGAIEASWVSLPAFEGTDLSELFCQSHSAADYPGHPATVAALPEIAAYYGLDVGDRTAAGEAALVAAGYRSLVAEHAREREAKGEAHWQRYDEGKAAERAEQARVQAVHAKREHRMNQINGLLWFAGAIIFTSLAIQLYQAHDGTGAIVIAVAVAIFAAVRGVINFRK